MSPTININKDLKASLQKTASLLRRGKNVVIFPEGARTRDGKLLPFKKSFAILSKILQVPVVPVVISGAFQAFPIGSRFPKPYRIKLKFLKPVYPEMSIEEIVKETEKRIKKEL
ncbi:MAG: lysophospholipid acyltransferase family protein [Persephonella sp.]|nr:lysophospholipid acyltransferase family protein [Persephonella sp.]